MTAEQLAGDYDKYTYIPRMQREYVTRGLTYSLPKAVTFGEDDQKRVTTLENALETYVEENTAKFIIGQKPMSDWDSFLSGLDKLGWQELAKLYNAN